MAEISDTDAGPGSEPGSEPDSGAAPTPIRGALSIVLSIAVVVLALDQAAKAWAIAALGDRYGDEARVAVLGDLFGFRLVRNPGAAFSMATGTTWIFTIIATVVVVVIVRMSRKLGSRLWTVAFGLLLGGATGNLTDRLFRAPGFARGHVVDFLELPHWPVFNLADSAICCAAALIVLASLRGVGIDGARVR
ncbi:signal peptidase II [Spongisporangium articulatum]|uniref:Lipoprotein signal peptidase n=1 Tax=Spongisporangium articulatum TaxID=3362603 RepID=A0ABW8ASP0_9ACTN